MRHLIIGCGVVGRATGMWLLANREDVFFWDKKQEVLNSLRREGYKVHIIDDSFDYYWVCTHEKNVEDVIKEIKKEAKNSSIIIIRSTTPVGYVKRICKKYKLDNILHIPEFLREKNALEDSFNPDRIVVGIPQSSSIHLIYVSHFFHVFDKPVAMVDSTTSEIVKLVSNAWLSTQISFWNEIKKLCDAYGVNPQLVADVCCLDKRISRYGAMMLGKPFGGKCLPKDLDSLIKCFKKKKINPVLLKSVKKVNEKIKEEKNIC